MPVLPLTVSTYMEGHLGKQTARIRIAAVMGRKVLVWRTPKIS